VLARLYPQDKTENASGLRRALAPLASAADATPPALPTPALPPLLERLLDKQASMGLPPAYLPKDDDEGDNS
jgi:hypothetical protein